MNKVIWNAFAHELEKVGGNAGFFQKLKNKTIERFKAPPPKAPATKTLAQKMSTYKEFPVKTTKTPQ